MTTPAWPSSLPQFVQESGYSESLPKVLIESQNEAGPPRLRRRFTSNWREIQAAIFCTEAQRLIFENFHHTTLADGVLPFTWVNPLTQAPKTFRFRLPEPTYRPLGGGNVIIQMNLWQLN